MKKIIVLLCAQLFVLSVFAQDVIITKDAQKIPAKVTDIEEAIIKYKKYDNLEGPTYTMKKADIATVVFENGSVEVFSDNSKQETEYNYYKTRNYLNYKILIITESNQQITIK